MVPLVVFVNKEIKTVSHDATLRKAAEMMRDQRIGSLLVVRGKDYVGVLSETDLVRKAMAEGLDPQTMKVERLMSSPIITIDIDKSAEEASDMMSEHSIRHLAVTENGKIVGIISVRDLLRYFKNVF